MYPDGPVRRKVGSRIYRLAESIPGMLKRLSILSLGILFHLHQGRRDLCIAHVLNVYREEPVRWDSGGTSLQRVAMVWFGRFYPVHISQLARREEELPHALQCKTCLPQKREVV
jgi:hypothetical protein